MRRLLVLSLLLCACTRKQENLSASVQPAVQQSPTGSVDRGADSIQNNYGGPTSLADSIGPRKLETSKVGASEVWLFADEFNNVDTLSAHFLSLCTIGELPRLLYRATPSDTVWTDLGIEFGKYNVDPGHAGLTIDETNLDGKGRKEVLVSYGSATYGSGSGTRWSSIYIVDLTPREPLLLLQAFTSEIDEAFPAYAAMHGDTLDPEDIETGFERTIKLQRREIIVGRIDTLGRPDEGSIPRLTQLPAGRYHYQNGKVFRVGK